MVVRVLVVDDQPDHVEMYHLALEYAGFTVEDAFSGGEGLEQARQLLPDVIVLDIRLPDMTGWDVCRVLRSQPATARIPIIVLTAAVTPTLAREAEEHGCAAHLLKPCSPDVLTSTIRQVLAAA